MRLLVTGATGFIGQHLVNRLIEQGHIVLALTRSVALLQVNHYPDKMFYLQSSLKLDENTLEKIKQFEPDTLIHLAWEKIPDFSFEISFANLQNQILFFRNLFSISSLKKIIVTGSCWEYNKKTGVCTESDICISGNYFTWAKNSLRDFLEFECLQKNINFIWSRVFYVYGPQQRKGSLIHSVIENIQNGIVPELKTPFNSNDFIYVDDVADGLIQFAVNDVPSGIYNLGNGESIPIIDVVSKIEILIHGKDILSSSVIENAPKSSVKNINFWADMGKTYNTLKWQPQTSLTLGIEKSLNIKK
jgi:nucleoside-diphosphate-sugar epimerase